jgi:predicted CoA-substrate-specific enzyme activase
MKVLLLDADRLEPVASAIVDQGVEQDALAVRILDELLEEKGLGRDDLGAVVATGYGRKLIRIAKETITEITCQAHGVRHEAPDVRTIIDIGGQDSKLVWLGRQGDVEDFAMNDRCAAGTGHFLEVLAVRLGVGLSGLGELAGKSCMPAIISSMCVVFAETEIVGLLASGARAEDIVAGVQAALAARVAAMAGHVMTSPIVLTGGVALVPGMDLALSSALGQRVLIAPRPQMTGALGAALLATQRL